jgi:hypothetical protein
MVRAYGSLMLAALTGVLLVTFNAYGADEVERAEVETYALKGGIYHVIPDEVLRRKGLQFPSVPRDRNAAYDYLAALEAYSGMRGKPQLYDLRERAIRHGWTADAQPLVEYLDANAGVLASLERAAAKPGCHFPFITCYEGSLDEGDFRVSDLPLPHL